MNHYLPNSGFFYSGQNFAEALSLASCVHTRMHVPLHALTLCARLFFFSSTVD
jgi:hypothetical protein